MKGNITPPTNVFTSSADISEPTIMPHPDLIKITDIKTDNIATVIIYPKYFPQDVECKELITLFIEVFTQALLISQNNKLNAFDVLVDCQDTTIKNVDYTFGKNLINIIKKAFDGNLNRCVIYNTNNIFKTVFKVITPLIDKNTRKKVQIF